MVFESPVEAASDPIVEALQRCHQASLELELMKGSERNRGILAIADHLEEGIPSILEANTLDLEASREMAVPELILDWLKLTPERLEATVELLRQLAELSDPIQRVSNALYQLSFYQSYCQRMPLGVVALIHEAFPELGAIAAGLCLKTANSLIIRGCGDGSNSNTLMAQIMQVALEDYAFPTGCVEYVSSEQGCTVQKLVTQDRYLNLVIPYGRPSLIQQVAQHSTVPVLRTTMGNCYLYWPSSGEMDLVRGVITDSHCYEPDAVNAIEKVLITGDCKPSTLISLFKSLQEKGFQLRGDRQLVADFPEHLSLAKDSEWGQAYLDRIVAFKIVEDLHAAIAWMNHYSSGHADCIVTESYEESRQFSMGIDSALVFINSSPRFSRQPQGSNSVFLGMSNQKGNRRGLIGLDSFTTFKQVVQGDGAI